MTGYYITTADDGALVAARRKDDAVASEHEAGSEESEWEAWINVDSEASLKAVVDEIRGQGRKEMGQKVLKAARDGVRKRGQVKA